MSKADLLEEAYLKFLEIESNEWGHGDIAAIRRYTWESWYRPSRIQFSRLVWEYISDEHVYAGGLPNLHNKIKKCLELTGGQPTPPGPGPVFSETSIEFFTADPSLGQIVCDEESRERVANLVHKDFPFGAQVALLGDDDMIGHAVAREAYPGVVYDIDSRIADLAQGHPYLKFRHHDIRDPLPLNDRFEAVLLDPADGSIALSKWLARTNECLSYEDGARVYLSINLWRLGKRWPQVLSEFLRNGLVPCAAYPRFKKYPHGTSGLVETDLWVFERNSAISLLPQPYLDIEVFR